LTYAHGSAFFIARTIADDWRKAPAGRKIVGTKSRSELLPLVNGRQAELLDNARLHRQLCLLERSTGGASGRERVDHPRGAHDDLANAAAGALVMARQQGELRPTHHLQRQAIVGDEYDRGPGDQWSVGPDPLHRYDGLPTQAEY